MRYVNVDCDGICHCVDSYVHTNYETSTIRSRGVRRKRLVNYVNTIKNQQFNATFLETQQ